MSRSDATPLGAGVLGAGALGAGALGAGALGAAALLLLHGSAAGLGVALAFDAQGSGLAEGAEGAEL